ncbi:MAG: hypothetical protein ABIT47_02840, partial [Candidatus Paceibacterota bacterium]
MTYNSTKQTLKSHPLRTGLFVVLAVLMAGGIVGMTAGFGNPTGAFAQVMPDIIVTAPPPVVALPPPPPVIVTPIAPIVVVPPVVAPVTNTNNNKNDDIVVTATKDTPTYGSPCCTAPTTGVTTPAIPGDIVVTATKDTPTYGSPCCTAPSVPAVEIPVYGSPCCTTPPEVIVPIIPPIIPIIPIVPIIPVIPPVIPPVVPPQTNEAGCIDITSSATGTISPGAAVTLTWRTYNTNTITIDNGVGTFDTATSSTGHVVVNPTTTTTYTGTVSNGTQNIHCKATVTVVPPTTGGYKCISLTADRTTITAADNA